MGLPLIWTQHLKDDDKKKDFESLVRNSGLVLSRVRSIASHYLETIIRTEVRESEYDSPSWSAKQAHRNGKVEAYLEMMQLFDFLDDQRRKP